MRIRNQRIKNWNSKIRNPGKRRLVLSGMVLIGLFLFGYLFITLPGTDKPPAEQQNPIDAAPKDPQPQEPAHQVVEGKIKQGSNFSKSLTEKNIPWHWVELIISKLNPYVNFRKIKGGTYRFITDVKGELVKFIYEAGPTEVYEVERDPRGYATRKKEVPLETYLVKAVGEIRYSLFEAMDAIGERDQLVISFAEILASEIDFYKDVREGDRFKLIVEEVYKGSEFIRYGTIHAVEYQRGERTIAGIAYQGSYYNEKGNSLRKSFLKAPLRFSRISSKFSRARRHPILGGVRPHYGVDYAAPTGTAIWAVADGTVVSCGWSGGFGNQVVLRHPNGYMTCYGHLSRYAAKIRRGAAVKQKQVIGYVGSTGLSTGPHLDYRLAKDGRFRNPLKESFPAGVPIGKGEMDRFQKRKDEMLALLEGDEPSKRRMEENGKIEGQSR